MDRARRYDQPEQTLLTDAEAKSVSDDLLEVTRRAYLSRDFALFGAQFSLPQTIGSFNGDRVIQNLGDLREAFDEMLANIDAMNVIDLQRTTLSALADSPTRIIATFETRYLQPGFVFSEPVVGHGELLLIDGHWRIGGARYATNLDGIARAMGAKSESARG